MPETQSPVPQDTPTPTEPANSHRPAEMQSEPSGASEKLVPVTEAIRYRKRAQAAEKNLNELKNQLDRTQAELDQTKQTIDQLERRHRIDQLLRDADAVDLEVARLLTETTVATMDQPDIQLAIEDLQRTKPYLFRRRPRGASAMPAHTDDDSLGQARQAAQQAAVSGDRRDLLRYLRLRRAPA